MQVDPQTFALNLALIIGAVVVLGIAFVTLFAVGTAIKVVVFEFRQRSAWAAFLKDSRRADGGEYPPYIEGICGQCGRGDRRIFHPPTGEALCPPCYERFWRKSLDPAAVPQNGLAAIGRRYP